VYDDASTLFGNTTDGPDGGDSAPPDR